jgi:hypothetical protein
VGPFQSGDAGILAAYQCFFADPSVRMLVIPPGVCERAARIRVASGLQFSAADRLHLAATIELGCGSLLTNDAQLARCTDIPVEILC